MAEKGINWKDWIMIVGFVIACFGAGFGGLSALFYSSTDAAAFEAVVKSSFRAFKRHAERSDKRQETLEQRVRDLELQLARMQGAGSISAARRPPLYDLPKPAAGIKIPILQEKIKDKKK